MAGIDVSKLMDSARPHADRGLSRFALVIRRIFSGVSKKTQEQFYFQLSTMLSSGVPIKQALTTLAEQHGGRKAAVFGGMSEGIAQGMFLSETMKRRPEVFDSLAQTLVKTGEMTGRLDENLARMGRYLERFRRVRSRMITALIYPLIILHAAVLIPNLLVLVKAGVMPYITTCAKTLIPLYLIVGFFWLVHQLLKVTRFYGEFLLSLFIFGTVVKKTALARFSRSMASLYEGGVSFPKALEVAGEATGNGALREQFREVSQVVQTGVGLAEALEKVRHVPVLVKDMVRTGEHTGRLEETLRKVADYYEHEAETTVDRLARIIPVVLYLMIMGYIAWMIISFYLNYYGPLLNM
ncbi:MAG: type II secretion system F family protein [Planctomycetota bacterium]